MALDQSALLNLLGELKLTDVTDRIRVATETLYQELIDAEATAFIGAAPFERSGAGWQRCRVHFMRNVLAVMPKGSQDMVASIIRTIFAQPDREHIEKQFRKVATMLARSHPKVTAMLVDAQPDLLAFAAFSRRHWRQIWSTNPLERVNKEIKRRTDVVGVFPNAAALLYLAGSVLTEQHDEWEAGERRYFSEASMLELATMNNPIEVIDEAVILPELAAA
ncbi:transposase-like protein [Cryobacterium psychrotolerans]|nr:transposase-like protein [Cryobacterium psychrotolerans]